MPIQARLANGHLHMTRHVANTPPTPYDGVVSFAHRRSVRDGGNENVVRLIDGWSISKVPLANLEFSEFERLIVRSQNELGTSVLLILGWIAASDGSVDRSEVKQLSEISIASKHGPSVEALLELLKKRDTSAIQLAAEIVSRHFRGEKAKLFLEMAIGMAIADRFLRPSENHILRFLADLLGVSKVELNEIFKGVTGRAIPDPGDLSSATYWRRQESAGATFGGRGENLERGTWTTFAHEQGHCGVCDPWIRERCEPGRNNESVSQVGADTSPGSVFFPWKRICGRCYFYISADQ